LPTTSGDLRAPARGAEQIPKHTPLDKALPAEHPFGPTRFLGAQAARCSNGHTTSIGALTSPSAAGAGVERIRIGVAHHGAGVAPLFAAVEAGYLRDEGLEPELISCPGHARSLAALIGGEVDFINSVGPELILANLRHGGDALVIASAIGRSAQQVAARPGIATREDLRGRRWGIVARNDADECAIRMAFERWQWDPVKDAEIVVVGSHAPRLDALLDPARVDAAILHAPEPFQAAKRGWNVLADLSRLDVAMQNSCAAATRRHIRSRPDTVLRYVRAYCRAVHRFRTDAGFGTALLRKYTADSDPAVTEATWVLFARLMGGMMFPSLEGMRTALALLHGLGAVPASAVPEDFVDLDPVATLESQGFFASLLGLYLTREHKSAAERRGGA
jgi:ABC-type nitrate/sulfonate/bicarbonate transport system substrate-binding protein